MVDRAGIHKALLPGSISCLGGNSAEFATSNIYGIHEIIYHPHKVVSSTTANSSCIFSDNFRTTIILKNIITKGKAI